MKLTTATWPWLLHHELRLAWRRVGSTKLWVVLIGGGFIWMALHLAAWGLLRGLSGVNFPPFITLILGGMTWLALSLMLSQAIGLSVTVLFDRGDFDLLLSSPVSARTVFIVRGIGVAISSVSLYLLILAPFAHVGLLAGHANLLAIYPALICLGLLVSALGMLLTLTLVRTLGARRARVVAQLFGALVGAAMFLLSQIQNMLSRETRVVITDHFKQWISPDGPLAADSVIWFPYRAMLGEWLPLLVIMAMGLGGFWLVVNLTYKRFLLGTQEMVTATVKKKSIAAKHGRTSFHQGLMANVLIKEWKLIARDPNLITQTLLQTLYLLPMIFLLFRRQDMALLVVPSSVILASTLAGSIAWITIAAEEAPDLIGVAPVELSRIRWMKAFAAVVPVWIMVSPVLFYLLFTHAFYAMVFAFCIAGGTLSAGLTQIWYPRLGDRKNLKKRAQGSMAMNMVEAFSAFGWAGMAYALLAAPLWTPVGMVVALMGPAGAWLFGKTRREQGMLA